MSVALIAGLGVVALIGVIAIKQRAATRNTAVEIPAKPENKDGGDA